MNCTEFCSDLPRGGALVIRRAVKSDGAGGNGAAGFRHRGNDAGGIDAARQERAQGNIRNHLRLDGAIDFLAKNVGGLLIGQGAAIGEDRPPVAFDARAFAGFKHHPMRRGQFRDAAIDRLRVGHIAVVKIVGDCARIEAEIDKAGSGDGADFRGKEEEAVIGFRVIKRALPEAVAGEGQASARRVIEAECKHAAKILQVLNALE